jgi:hypothetical protein
MCPRFANSFPNYSHCAHGAHFRSGPISRVHFSLINFPKSSKLAQLLFLVPNHSEYLGLIPHSNLGVPAHGPAESNNALTFPTRNTPPTQRAHIQMHFHTYIVGYLRLEVALRIAHCHTNPFLLLLPRESNVMKTFNSADRDSCLYTAHKRMTALQNPSSLYFTPNNFLWRTH